MSVPATEALGSRRASVLQALEALDAHDVEYALRNGDLAVDDLAADVDVLVRPGQLPVLHRVLTGVGWALLRAPGHRGHRFYLREAADLTWVKLDVVTEVRYGRRRSDTAELIARRRLVAGLYLVSPEDAAQHAENRQAGLREVASPVERVLRALPTSLRRRGCVVAVLGPDGAGKGTVTAALAASLPVAVTQVYLGDRRAQTASAARPDAGTGAAPAPSGLLVPVREVAFLLRKLVRWLPALLRASVAAWRGHVVLTDRHPLDAVAVRPPRSPIGAAVEHLLATRVVPAPDALVLLDAPGSVLFDRKGEHTPELLETWRQGYRSHLVPRGGVLVDASGPVGTTVAQARHVVWRALAARRGWTGG